MKSGATEKGLEKCDRRIARRLWRLAQRRLSVGDRLRRPRPPAASPGRKSQPYLKEVMIESAWTDTCRIGVERALLLENPPPFPVD